MADFGSPVAQDVTTPNLTQTLSGLMSVQKTQQDIQAQKLAMQGQASQNISLAAKAQGDQRVNAEQQGITNMFKTGKDDLGNSIRGEDGNLDPTKVIPALGRIAPLTGQDMAQNILKSENAKVGLQSASVALDMNQRQGLQGIAQAGAASGAPSSEINANIDNFAGAHKNPLMDNAASYLKQLTPHLDKIQDPKARLQAGQQIASLFQPGSAVETQEKPGSMDRGGSIQPGLQGPAIAGGGFTPVGAPIDKTLAPQVVTYPSGALGTVGGARGGPATGPGGGSAPPAGPRTAAQDAPPPNAPKAIQDAYQGAVQKANGHVDDVRTADESYGNNMSIANAIRRLSKSADTGPGTDTWNHVMGALGTDKANNAQELGAFLDRQAATVRGQMGLPGTNAGAEDAKSIVGNTGYNAKVIQDKNDYTQALTEGLHQYRKGLDRVAGFGGQASPKAVDQFKSAWAQNFDPNVYKGELAYGRSKAEGDAFVRSLSPDEAKSLAAKRAALSALSQGQLQQ